jgi:hypothetical protein
LRGQVSVIASSPVTLKASMRERAGTRIGNAPPCTPPELTDPHAAEPIIVNSREDPRLAVTGSGR